MVVTGAVEVNPDGRVHAYTIDQQDKVPADVMAVIGKDIPRWDFKSPGGVVKATMSLLIVNKPIGDGKYAIAVSGVSFGGYPDETGESVKRKAADVQPIYPEAAINARVSGTVYVLLRVSRDGTVDESVAEQVNLDQYGSQSQMNQLRKMLADASLKAAKHWTFDLPTRGKEVADPYWLIRIPVNFRLYGAGHPKEEPAYGTWHVYIPGPRQTPSWTSQILLSEAPDAMRGSEPHTGNPMLQLQTSPSGT
ncbi:energy transducer TonB [Dyella sp. EPa41]|uniref:energy transducer TonB n=1 Tax=Dyella sp. EPa41 TaxID=1561194 RepID=UPI001915D9E1|nr:energy transducer TonB [Dyella sp. EPa41]